MNNKETALVETINAIWVQYEKDIANVYAVPETLKANRNQAIADAIVEFETVAPKGLPKLSPRKNLKDMRKTTNDPRT